MDLLNIVRHLMVYSLHDRQPMTVVIMTMIFLLSSRWLKLISTRKPMHHQSSTDTNVFQYHMKLATADSPFMFVVMQPIVITAITHTSIRIHRARSPGFLFVCTPITVVV